MSAQAVELRFLGHACVLLRAGGQSLLVDPYNPGGFGGRMGYRPVPYAADAVVCSHGHADHCAIDDLPNRPQVLEPPARFGPFAIDAVCAWHDEYEGRRRGGAVAILEIAVGGLRIVHLSDVGHSPTPGLVERLRAPDVLVVPVGGFYTIGAAQADEWCRRLGARLVVPVHYRTEACGLGIRGVEGFEAYRGSAGGKQSSFVELSFGMLSLNSRMVVLEPECRAAESTVAGVADGRRAATVRPRLDPDEASAASDAS